jgi:hypothetical protein
MATNNHARIGSRFFAIVLLGLLTEVAVAADTDTGTGGRQDDAPSNVSTAPSSSQTSPSGDAASETAAKNTEDIDTRITVRPHHPGDKPGKVGEVKAKFSLSGVKNPHRRVFSASGANKQTVRNAVSIAVGQRELLDRRPGEHPFVMPAPHLPAGAVGVVGNTTAGIAKTDSGLVRQIIVPPSASQTSLNRGISGTTARHRGISPASIGGPARTTAGLDGTTIRPTH